jgi:hypothetical protein
MMTEHSTAAPRRASTPSLYGLMATYWARYDELVTAMRVTDETDEQTSEREEANARQNTLGDVLDEAVIAILQFIPAWRVDAEIKASFVKGLADRNGGTLYEAEIAALVSTLAVVYSPEKGAAQ